MANYTAAGDVLTSSSVKAGSNPASFTLPVAATTGAITGTTVDFGAVYGTPIMWIVGGSGTGTLQLDGSLDGVNWIAADVASTAASASNQRITTTVNTKPVRFLRINVTVAIATAPVTVVYGCF